jgi:PAS domain S-box-containing protein
MDQPRGQAMSIPEPDTTMPKSVLQGLRRRAEDIDRVKVHLPLELVQAVTPADAQLLFHELRVHQVELELQNEELRRAQLELEAGRERYFDLYDMAPVGYCTVDDKGLILEANLTAASLLGMSRMALAKRQILRFMPHPQQQIYLQSCQRLRASGQTQTCELQLQKDNGATIWVSLSVNSGKSSAGLASLRVMLTDITVRMQLDHQLREKNAELLLARQEADKANRAKSEFLASMSHELRSPLNAILGFAQLLDAGLTAPTAAQKQAIDQILHGGWYLLDLVNDILDLAAIETGHLALSLNPEPLAEVLLNCQVMIEPLAMASGIQVHFQNIDKGLRVQADRRRLKQVLVNLLTNAIKYNCPQGTVAVSWEMRPGARVRIMVKDSGSGLTADKLAQLFQPFNRLGQEASAVEGTGIGLVVSKQLVEMMGGQIGADSTLGAGSVFWFELALARDKT